MEECICKESNRNVYFWKHAEFVCGEGTNAGITKCYLARIYGMYEVSFDFKTQ